MKEESYTVTDSATGQPVKLHSITFDFAPEATQPIQQERDPAPLHYAYAEALAIYTAELASELLIDASPNTSTLQKHRAILHRQEAAEAARKLGATMEDLHECNAMAARAIKNGR